MVGLDSRDKAKEGTSFFRLFFNKCTIDFIDLKRYIIWIQIEWSEIYDRGEQREADKRCIIIVFSLYVGFY